MGCNASLTSFKQPIRGIVSHLIQAYIRHLYAQVHLEKT